jgi:hypothetical protein
LAPCIFRGDSVAKVASIRQYRCQEYYDERRSFNTLKLADRLQAGGFTAEWARTFASSLAEVANAADVVTKPYLDDRLVALEQRLNDPARRHAGCRGRSPAGGDPVPAGALKIDEGGEWLRLHDGPWRNPSRIATLRVANRSLSRRAGCKSSGRTW